MFEAKFFTFLVAVCGVLIKDDCVELDDCGDGVCGAGAGGDTFSYFKFKVNILNLIG